MTTPPSLSAWVLDDDARRAHESALRRSLVGRRIERVRYAELRYENTTGPMWPADGFDSLDFGLELDLDDGATWSVIWHVRDGNEGLLAYQGSLVPAQLPASADPVIWDVTERWHAHGPREIAAVTPIWVRVEDLCQNTLILHGSDDREAVLTLGTAADNGRFTPSADDIAVFFSTADAAAAGVCLEPEPPAGQ